MNHQSLVEIHHFTEIVKETLGEDWIEKKRPSSKKKRNKANVSYRYAKEKHPAREWYRQYKDGWLPEVLKEGYLPPHSSVLDLIQLGQSIALTRSLLNFDDILRRLKRAEEFYKASFEVEVAAQYVGMGYSVEFVRNKPNEKTPDLKVTLRSGRILWVECKRIDDITPKEHEINLVWDELEQRLLKYLISNKANYYIFITVIGNPIKPDISPLLSEITNEIRRIEYRDSHLYVPPSGIYSFRDSTGKYTIILQKTLPKDTEIAANGIKIIPNDGYDRKQFWSEVKRTFSGESYWRNPVGVFLKKIAPLEDRSSTIINAFATATNQIPKSGPGAIWIRVPWDVFPQESDEAFRKEQERIGNLIHSKMKHENRNINFTSVITFRPETFGYKPVQITVFHDNPRLPIV